MPPEPWGLRYPSNYRAAGPAGAEASNSPLSLIECSDTSQPSSIRNASLGLPDSVLVIEGFLTSILRRLDDLVKQAAVFSSAALQKPVLWIPVTPVLVPMNEARVFFVRM